MVCQRDGRRPHDTKETIDRLRWPANRCDLNPIEMVWAIIGPRLAGRRFSDGQGLFDALQEMWNALSMDAINGLVLGFPRRGDLGLEVREAWVSQ
jgi:transposase